MMTMDKEKAKFILSAYQPGAPASEQTPELREAVELAAQDAELADWLAKQSALDERVSAALGEITVPRSLRRNILEGMELSRRKRERWAWLEVFQERRVWASALALVVICGFIVFQRVGPPGPEGAPAPALVQEAPRFEPWQQGALAMLTGGFQLEMDRNEEPGLNRQIVRDWLTARDLAVPESVLTRVGDQQLMGCVKVPPLPGVRVSAVCFRSAEGPMIHIITATEPPDPAAVPEFGAPLLAPQLGSYKGYHTLSWREGGDKAIMLVSQLGPEALHAVIRGE